MDKELLSSKITDALGTTQLQLSERTISEYLDNVLPGITDDAQVTDEFIGRHVNILKSLNGNLHNDVSREVEEYKKRTAPKPEPPKPTDAPKPEDNEMPAWFKAYKEEQDAKYAKLETERKAEKDAQTKEELQKRVENSLKSRLKDSGVDVNMHIFKETIKNLTFEVDADAKTLVVQAEKDYNENMKDLGLDFDFPMTPRNERKPGKTAADDFFARKKAKEGWGNK